jgi:hypothetical protein
MRRAPHFGQVHTGGCERGTRASYSFQANNLSILETGKAHVPNG